MSCACLVLVSEERSFMKFAKLVCRGESTGLELGRRSAAFAGAKVDIYKYRKLVSGRRGFYYA